MKGRGNPEVRRTQIRYRVPASVRTSAIELLQPAIVVFHKKTCVFNQRGRNKMSFRQKKVANCLVSDADNLGLQVSVSITIAIKSSLSTVKLHVHRAKKLR